MSRGAMEWHRVLRERDERRSWGELQVRRAGWAEARRLRGARLEAGGRWAVGAGEVGLAGRRAAWAVEEEERQARQVEEGLARALASRAAAEAARTLDARHHAAARGQRLRRDEEASAEERLARLHRVRGAGTAGG